MKKYVGVVLPLLALSFLASCGGKDNTNYKVTKEEYEHALTFENVEYAQSEIIEKETEVDDTYEVTRDEYSPTIYTNINFDRHVDTREDELSGGRYVIKNDNKYMVSEYDGETAKWSEPEEGEARNFAIASESLSMYANDIIKYFQILEGETTRSLTYDDLKYLPNKREYFASNEFEAEGMVISRDIHIAFDNKKIVKIVFNQAMTFGDMTEAGGYDFNVNYKETTPVVPPVIK